MYLPDNEILDISLQTESYFIPNDFKITSKTIIKKEKKQELNNNVNSMNSNNGEKKTNSKTFEKKIRNRITNYRIFKRLL